MRVNLSVAIVALTENRTIINEDGSTGYYQFFNWSPQKKGFALGAFFYGYITTQLAGGILASKVGGHLVRYKKKDLSQLSDGALRAPNFYNTFSL